MKENVLDVLMYLFENYFYDEPEEQPDRASMEENLHEAGFSNGEIDKAFKWLDGLAEQRFQPEFSMQSDEPIRVFVDSEINRLDTTWREESTNWEQFDRKRPGKAKNNLKVSKKKMKKGDGKS